MISMGYFRPEVEGMQHHCGHRLCHSAYVISEVQCQHYRAVPALSFVSAAHSMHMVRMRCMRARADAVFPNVQRA